MILNSINKNKRGSVSLAMTMMMLLCVFMFLFAAEVRNHQARIQQNQELIDSIALNDAQNILSTPRFASGRISTDSSTTIINGQTISGVGNVAKGGFGYLLTDYDNAIDKGHFEGTQSGARVLGRRGQRRERTPFATLIGRATYLGDEETRITGTIISTDFEGSRIFLKGSGQQLSENKLNHANSRKTSAFVHEVVLGKADLTPLAPTFILALDMSDSMKNPIGLASGTAANFTNITFDEPADEIIRRLVAGHSPNLGSANEKIFRGSQTEAFLPKLRNLTAIKVGLRFYAGEGYQSQPILDITPQFIVDPITRNDTFLRTLRFAVHNQELDTTPGSVSNDISKTDHGSALDDLVNDFSPFLGDKGSDSLFFLSDGRSQAYFPTACEDEVCAQNQAISAATRLKNQGIDLTSLQVPTDAEDTAKLTETFTFFENIASDDKNCKSFSLVDDSNPQISQFSDCLGTSRGASGFVQAFLNVNPDILCESISGASLGTEFTELVKNGNEPLFVYLADQRGNEIPIGRMKRRECVFRDASVSQTGIVNSSNFADACLSEQQEDAFFTTSTSGKNAMNDILHAALQNAINQNNTNALRPFNPSLDDPVGNPNLILSDVFPIMRFFYDNATDTFTFSNDVCETIFVGNRGHTLSFRFGKPRLR